MKKIISIIAVLGIAALLTACGDTAETVVNATAATTPAPPATVEDMIWAEDGMSYNYTGEIDGSGNPHGKGTLTMTFTGDLSGLVGIYNGTMSNGACCNGVVEYFYNDKSMGLTSVSDGVESESDVALVVEAIQKENSIFGKIKDKAGEVWDSVKEGIADGFEKLFE